MYCFEDYKQQAMPPSLLSRQKQDKERHGSFTAAETLLAPKSCFMQEVMLGCSGNDKTSLQAASYS